MAGIDSNTKLLMQMNNGEGSTSWTDSAQTPNTLTGAGNAQQDTGVTKFGASTGLFDGSGDYVTVPDAAWMDFGTGDFTVDFWMYMTTRNTNNVIMSRNSTNEFDIRYTHSITAMRMLLMGTDYQFTTTLVINTWYHFALVRSSGTLKCYQDGTALSAGSASSDNISSTQRIMIANSDDGAFSIGIVGNLDELRISNVARWTANFTPPTAEYSADVRGALSLMGVG